MHAIAPSASNSSQSFRKFRKFRKFRTARGFSLRSVSLPLAPVNAPTR